MKSIKWRILIRVSAVLIVLFLIIQALDFNNFRNLAINSAKDKALTIALTVKSSLTSLMKLGQIQNRDIFLKSLEENKNVESVKIIRGIPIIKQFGEGRPYEKPTDEIEKMVLVTGKQLDRLEESINKVEYKIVIPYRAENECLQCHKAKVGDVLGAISITMDLTEIRKAALIPLFTTSFVMFIVFIFTAFMIFKFFKPYTDFFRKLKEGLDKAKEGDFSEKIEIDTKDEASLVANAFNEMTQNLSKTLKTIQKKVSYLIGHSIKSTGNALKDSMMIIDELIKIYNFKRVIEKDTSKEEIYKRIRNILMERNIEKYSFYEIEDRHNKLRLVFKNGTENMWCSESILENPDLCRAKRTGMEVDSSEFACICPYFIECSEGIERKHNYHCIPVYVGGKVKNIIQFVYKDEKAQEEIPFIKSYLEEASPVLEAKALLDMLKEQSTVDELTGLYNRRFLEQLIPKLVSQTLRRKSTIGILMIDIDFFKQVNDEYGHDVGDKVLKEIANIIKNSIRESDLAIRYGGEEFMVLLMDVNPEKAVEIAEKIRKRIENKIIAVGSITLRKTASIGVSIFPIDSDQFWQCIKFADVALYKAKEEGRNRVVRFRKEMWESEEY